MNKIVCRNPILNLTNFMNLVDRCGEIFILPLFPSLGSVLYKNIFSIYQVGGFFGFKEGIVGEDLIYCGCGAQYYSVVIRRIVDHYSREFFQKINKPEGKLLTLVKIHD